MTEFAFIGKRVPKLDAIDKVTGRAVYGHDMKLPRMLYGKILRSERAHAHTPQGHWQTTSVISSIRLDGSTACLALEGATDTESFRTYVQTVLLPTLRPGDEVLMDKPLPAQEGSKAGLDHTSWGPSEVPASLLTGLQPH